MNSIRVIEQTDETVTVSRTDFEAVLDAILDARGLDAIAARRLAESEAGGYRAARPDYLTSADMRRILSGEPPSKIWREKRGITQAQLARLSGVNVNYLCEIEAGKKPGSASALAKLGTALGVSPERLLVESVGSP